MEQKIQSFFQRERVCLGKVLPLDTPFNIFIDISEVCNFKCKYCFRGDKNIKEYGYALNNNLMSWETFVKVIDQIEHFPNPIKKISLSGHGEPLCNKLLPRMVDYIKGKGINAVVEIHTNASLLDKDFCDQLINCGIDKVNISLQGISATKYKEVCKVEIDYEKFYDNLKYFYENRRKTIINIKIADIALDENEKEKFYEQYCLIADHVYVEKIVPLWKEITYNKELNSNQENKLGEKIEYQSSCALSFYSLVIAPDGTIYPCTQPLMSFNLGNIAEKSLIEVWNGEQRISFLKKQLEQGRNNICDCKDCYIAQNSIMSKEDSINGYSEEILSRL